MSAEQDRFMLAGFTEPAPASGSFEKWPQHFAVLPWMVGNIEVSMQRIDRVLSIFDSFDITVGNQVAFGDGSEIAVRLQPFDELKRLHRAARTILHGAARVEDSRFLIEYGYNPHITLHAGQPALEEGDVITVKELFVVQSDQGEKQIARAYGLGDGHEAATRR